MVKNRTSTARMALKCLNEHGIGGCVRQCRSAVLSQSDVEDAMQYLLASSRYSSNQPTDPLPNYFLASGFLLPVYEHSFGNGFIFTAATASCTF